VRKLLILVLALTVTALAATGCSNTQTFASQCAYQIKNGYFDARHVSDILHPGERKNSNNVTTRYVYCNARNYIFTSHSDATADVHAPIEAKTSKNDQGDGTPVNVDASAHFALNQNEPTMLSFLGFCEKYNCFASKDTTDNGSSSHSSSPGWMNMLNENMRFAMQRATQVAMQKFPPDVWNNQSSWPAVGDAISAELKQQIKNQIGGTDQDYFCGTGVHLKSASSESAVDSWTCPDISVTVDNVTPVDPGVRNIYNQEVRQQQLRQLAVEKLKTNQAELTAAKARYGDMAETFLGIIDACQGKQSCYIVPNLIK
jgi:hypothetical protein